MKRPNPKEYLQYRGGDAIISDGHAENYIDALEDYIDYLKSNQTVIDSDLIEFSCYLSGHDEKTILQMYKDWKLHK